MEFTISMPDSVFHEGDELSKRLGISRNELFCKAIENYIEVRKRDIVRESLDEIYARETSGLDGTLAQIQWASLPKEDWQRVEKRTCSFNFQV
jgi:metal-responsive CopG/Arc/MetJ family transcriptional regulator